VNADILLFLTLLTGTGVIAYAVLRSAGLELRRPSPASLFFIYFLANAYIGLGELVFKTQRLLFWGVTDDSVLWLMLLLAAGSLLAMALGFRMTPGTPNVQFKRPEPLTGPGTWMVLLLFGICCIALVLYIQSLPRVPLFAALQGYSDEAFELRMTLGTSNYVTFGKPQYFNAFLRVLMPFLSSILLAQALAKPSRTAIAVAIGGGLLTAFASIVDTHKGGVVQLLFTYWLTYLIAGRRTLKLRQVLPVMVGLVALSTYLFSVFMGATFDSVDDGISAVTERLFIGNLVPAYHFVDLFKGQELLWGRSFPNPLGLFPYSHYPIDAVVWQMLNPWAVADVSYSAPAVLWAEMFANFGIAGVLISAPLLGSIARLSQGLFDRVAGTPLRTALIVFWSMYFMGFVTRGVIQMITLTFDYYVAGVLLASLVIFEVDRRARPLVWHRRGQLPPGDGRRFVGTPPRWRPGVLSGWTGR
jgi:oligosaccharide repeat unit polymerase